MAVALSLLAVLLAAAACLVALRTARHVRQLARALAREWGVVSAAPRPGEEPRPAAPARPDAEHEAWLRRSVESLEQRLREALARAAQLESFAAQPAPAGPSPAGPSPAGPRPAGPSPASPAGAAGAGASSTVPAPGLLSPREAVRAHLEALGYEEIALLPGTAPGTCIFEAREQGMPRKGSARVDEQGRVRLRQAGAQRVFP